MVRLAPALLPFMLGSALAAAKALAMNGAELGNARSTLQGSTNSIGKFFSNLKSTKTEEAGREGSSTSRSKQELSPAMERLQKNLAKYIQAAEDLTKQQQPILKKLHRELDEQGVWEREKHKEASMKELGWRLRRQRAKLTTMYEQQIKPNVEQYKPGSEADKHVLWQAFAVYKPSDKELMRDVFILPRWSGPRTLDRPTMPRE